MAYLGILIYSILLYIRPADWVPAVRDWPLDFFSLGATVTVVAVALLLGLRHEPLVPQLPFLALWVLVIFLSNAVHGDFDRAIFYTIDYAKHGLMFIAFWMAVSSRNKFRGLILLLILLSGVLGLQGIYQKQHSIGWAGQPLYWDNRICWVGLWDGANVLSLLFVTSVPFVLEVITGKWSWIAKLLAAVCGALMITGMILAASRGGWLSLTVVILLYCTRKAGKKGMVGALLLMMALMAVAPGRLTRQGDERDESSSRHRVDMWAEGLEMVRYNPLFGIGKGEFENYTGLLIAHNSFIQTMGETGLAGLFAWLGLLYISFKGLRAVLRQSEVLDKELVSFAQAMMASLTGYLSASMFITTDFDLLYLIMGLCAAVLSIARRESEDVEMSFTVVDLRNIAGLTIGTVIMMYGITRALS